VVVALSIAYLAGTAYLIYRDDLLGSALARQAGMQHAYEDRIAALRAEIDRVTSRHVVARQGIGEQVALLLDRQALIGQRQQQLDNITATAGQVGIDVATALAPLPRSRPERALAQSGNLANPALAYAAGGEAAPTSYTAASSATLPEVQPILKPLLSRSRRA
jgi:hypothetical protein